MDKASKGYIGKMGEKTAVAFLANDGHLILDTNYRKPWGELDIVTQKWGIVHFVEVKTVQRDLEILSHGGYQSWYEASENMHLWKRKRLARVIATYIEERFGSRKGEPRWQLDLLLVYLDLEAGRAKIESLDDLELL